MVSDWRFRKSLALIIPPSSEVEIFFTRLRKELLAAAVQQSVIPPPLKSLTEALAAQCFLNEYIYSTSKKEEDCISEIIDLALNSQEAANKYLPIIGCYKSICSTDIGAEFINNYPILDDCSQEFISSQFTEPLWEKKIKASFQSSSNISGIASKRVKEMYEENPYPRFKCADFTVSKLAKPISLVIELESTRREQSFPAVLSSSFATPKILVAGCGTGSQVLNASRYKNAQITAIDLSTSSLAYASRKAKEYAMSNVDFKLMDLLHVADLAEKFDVIECSGVLHHMERPSDGLFALVQQLRPGGYIKLGLYSEIARSIIVDTRSIIKELTILPK